MTVHVVVPEGIDDPGRPSGGNVYDRRLCDELVGLGWTVHEHHASGGWPRPSPADQEAFARVVAALPDQGLVLVDGLVGSAAEAMVAEAGRLRLVVLVHMPLAGPVEGAALRGAGAVVTTSRWAREQVIDRHAVAPDRVHVAVPGVETGPRVVGSDAGGHLLCVGAVTPDKGQDVLLDALCQVQDLEWRCTFAGALDLDPAFVDGLTATARRSGVAGRVTFTGPLSPSRLEAARSATDLVVSASRRESYGMAVAEGLARGIPVMATSVGGVPEALVGADEGSLPGWLVPVGDTDRLAAVLRRWLTDPELRERMRRSAARRRSSPVTWAETARTISAVLSRVISVNRAPLAPVSPTSRHGSDG